MSWQGLRREIARCRASWSRLTVGVKGTVEPPCLVMQVLSMGVHKAEITRSTQPATAKDAQACGVRLLHAINMYDRRFNVTKAATDGHFTNVTDWQWVL